MVRVGCWRSHGRRGTREEAADDMTTVAAGIDPMHHSFASAEGSCRHDATYLVVRRVSGLAEDQ